MSRNDMIKRVARQLGLQQADCEKVIDGYFEQVKQALMNGDRVIIKNFMSLEVSERPERQGRDPQTGEIKTFPALKVVKCRVSKAIKDAINNK